MTLTIDVDPELERRLSTLAERTGGTKADLLRDALRNGMEDLEDYLDAVEVSKRLRRGEERVYSADEVRRELGMDD